MYSTRVAPGGSSRDAFGRGSSDPRYRAVAPLEPEITALCRAARQNGLPDGALASRFGLTKGVPVQRLMRVVSQQIGGGPVQKLFGPRVDGGDAAAFVRRVGSGGQ
ncbi:hypothetical protein [Streptomyces sp. NPDC091294]|uniref:hypothetical protein n=1 Tax=Streptomyces sp. NPDC091294 TaxID=3365992 RepID=UPI003806A8A4